ADRGASETVAVPADARDDAVDEVARPRVAQISKAQGVEQRDRARAHRADVAQDPAHSGGRPLDRLDERGMVVALDLEDDGPAVADVERARILTGPLQYARSQIGRASR